MDYCYLLTPAKNLPRKDTLPLLLASLLLLDKDQDKIPNKKDFLILFMHRFLLSYTYTVKIHPLSITYNESN